ncbi:hypothetical protein [Cellulosimicrobium sp. CUA-896]|uniref:hypothetical protein n=1 Tax=Cellulosimicrobium sp. CUA-896 TaxID=1517881 RepID=UPI00095F9AFA|nr:hypothetical protein [Cellulosimicrobium sp. CUA-896]OLT55077.1 hypothetical protein BJF88_07380 [Cellulosimicrobium sp. CUA-896]
MSTSTHRDDAADRVLPAPSRGVRTVSQVLISSALGITLAAALAGSAQPREGASFFASTAVSGTVETVARDVDRGLDETQQIQGAIEVLATANALDSDASARRSRRRARTSASSSPRTSRSRTRSVA